MEELEGSKKNNKKKKMAITLLVVLSVIVVVGTSYALWQLTFTQSGTNVITTGCLNLTLMDEADAINLIDATPTSDEEGRSLTPYTFTLTNTCTTEVVYVINLETVSSGTKILRDEYVKTSLFKGTEEVFIDKLVESHQNLDKVITDASKAYMLNSGKLAGNESISYSLRLWMDEDTEALDEVMEATWQGKITVTASYVPPKVDNDNELYVKVKKQAVLDNVASEFVAGASGVDFGEVSSDNNGKGVYTIADTKDSEYPIHYFRGNVTNNNVKFANLCWKIVRTTETGGVKLIYNGAPNEAGGCTNTTGEITQIGLSQLSDDKRNPNVGYMYPETTNEDSSPIKTTIDTWYQNNMTDFTSYLEDTVWCNDRSIYNENEDDYSVIYKVNQRINVLKKPSIGCSNDNDRFTVRSEVGNGKLTYPVALLTADELVFAGYKTGTDNSSNYLYTNQNWWSLSMSSVDINASGVGFASGYYATSTGVLDSDYTNTNYGVRPSVSLLPGTLVVEGTNGSPDNPFEIVLNNA